MFDCKAHSMRTHDLLQVDANDFISADRRAPRWVDETLQTIPFVVVRRGPSSEERIPVGVRGMERNQRWPTFCAPTVVKRIITPLQLLGRAVPASRADAAPALRSLHLLENRWLDVDRPWGPGGSVGFELATGAHAARPESDLDIILYAETRITAGEARFLRDSASDLPAVVDIRVETPFCGFSLKEYAGQSPAAILLRTPCAVVCGSDPWSESGITDLICAAARQSRPL
jgi:phosphoribosyl-dephospho-CoA transferase